MDQRPETLMKLLHLADSALPIGSAAHSYGMETLVFDGDLTVEHLMDFFVAYVEEAGAVEADYCGKSYAIGADLAGVAEASVDPHVWTPWLRLNRQLSARKPARESRVASATLGRRLIRLALALEFDPRLHGALRAIVDADLHHATAYGLLGGWWSLGTEETVLSFLQQMVAGMVSACQRLMPLGQNRAQSIQWSLHPTLAATARNAVSGRHQPASIGATAVRPSFTPLLEVGSMRHATLPTRLFVS